MREEENGRRNKNGNVDWGLILRTIQYCSKQFRIHSVGIERQLWDRILNRE